MTDAQARTVPDGREDIPVGVKVHGLDNLIGRYLKATMSEEACEATGANGEIIVFLKRCEDEGREVYPQDLERRFGVTRSTCSRVLALMERKGLVERASVAHDARLKRIALTDKARALERRLHDNAEGMEAVLLAGIPPEDLAAMHRCLEVMRENMLATGRVGRG